MISFFDSRLLRGESGAKIIPFSNTLQIFEELFLKNFFFAIFALRFLFRSECKDTARNKYKPNILKEIFIYVINIVINTIVNNLLDNC